MLTNVRLLFFKELLGAVRDRRTVLLTVIFPLVFYPLVLSVMGRVMSAEAPALDAAPATVAYVERVEDPWLAQAVGAATGVRALAMGEVTEALAAHARGEVHLVAIPAAVGDGRERSVELHYDPADPLGVLAALRVREGIRTAQGEALRERLAAIGEEHRSFAPDVIVTTVAAAAGEPTARIILSRLLPYFLVLAILTGAMNLGAEITAGEKERGTIATLLVSQLSRTEIVVGKFAAVLTVSLVSSVLSAVGLMVGLRFFGAGLAPGGAATGSSGFALGLAQLGWILLILVPLAIVIAALVIIVGSYARSQKEASTYLIPVYMVIVLVGLASMTGVGGVASTRFLIPVANALFALQGVILGAAEPLHLLYTFAANTALGALLVVVSVRLFLREAILFRS
ncbi:MAG: ABC transporter permease [Candidatus Bipolaricaulota bacterium]|nr:MAG: ABC transporter permease [Candidatus Bipolaricaulota bacterium]